MADFATVKDVEDRWRTLDAAEKTRAGALIKDAALLIRAECPTVDDRILDESLDSGIPLLVTVRLVKRAMSAGVGGFDGMSSQQNTAGPFSQTVSFANPGGDMFLTKADKKLLGCSSQKAFTVDVAPDVGWW